MRALEHERPQRVGTHAAAMLRATPARTAAAAVASFGRMPLRPADARERGVEVLRHDLAHHFAVELEPGVSEQREVARVG